MIEIQLKSNVSNESIQIGDSVYFVTPSPVGGFDTSSDDPTLIGEVTEIGLDYVIVGDEQETPSKDDFIMFQKDRVVNNASLLGYYAEVKLKNNSTEKAELFSLGSEIVPSSK